jgi:glutathione S-transferase
MIIIYGASLSPFVRKALVFAAEKGIAIENQVTSPFNPSEEFLAASPFKKIPALRDGDFTVADSSAIIHYLDALKADPELIPTAPKARARAIWFEELADTLLTPAGGKIFYNRVLAPMFGREADLGAADKAEQEELPPLFAYLEDQVPDSRHLVDDRLTLADIAVASPFATIGHLGIRPDPGQYPRLAAFLDSVLGRESFRSLIADEANFFQTRG